MDSAKETANALGATMEKAFKEQQNQDKKSFLKTRRNMFLPLRAKHLRT